ncbi:MAG: hypothetical protein U0P45_10365 [Acidimicrobiales bacterium]
MALPVWIPAQTTVASPTLNSGPSPDTVSSAPFTVLYVPPSSSICTCSGSTW